MSAKPTYEELEQRVKDLENDAFERKRAGKQLQASEVSCRTLAESFPGLVYRVFILEDNRMQFFNDQLQSMTGYKEEELKKGTVCSIDPLILTEDMEKIRISVENAIRKRTHFEVAYRITHRDGDIRYFLERGRPILGANGKSQYIDGIIFDVTDRKRAEEALRTSEAQLSNAMKIAQLGYWEYDVANDLFVFNDHFYAIFRTSAEKVGGYQMSSARYAQLFVHPDDMPVVNLEIQKAIESTDPNYSRQIEHRIIYADGEIGYISVRLFIVKDSQGRTVKTYGANQDVTDRKRAEEALRESEERYRILVENAGEAICVAQEGMLKFANKKAEELSGRTQTELLSTAFENFIHPDDRDFVLERQVKRQQGIAVPSSYSFRLIAKSGEVKWVESDVVIINWEDRFATLNFLRNISDRKRADEALRESESNLQSVFDAVPVGICFMKDRVYRRANRNWCETFGYPEESLLGKTPELLYENKEEYLRVGEELYGQLLKDGIASVCSKLKRSDGEFRDVVLTAKPLDSQNIEAGTVVVIRDITRQKRAEEEKEMLEGKLRQAQKIESIGTLAGGIAHDFNNILGIILGNTELAIDDVPEWNPARNNLDEVRKACLRAKDVVRQILAFSRKSETEQKTISMAAVVTESLKLLRASIPTSIDIRQNIADDIDDILGDPTQIHQIMINLCTNAAHAMENEGGTLEVAVENTLIDADIASRYADLHPGPYVQLKVSDTGDGINPEVIDRIFDPYFTTKDVGKGTGLGLSVVHGIVNSHNGRITFLSNAGKGTTFNIFFPAIERQCQKKPKQLHMLPTGQERVLFVDDETSIVNLNQHRLERLGYKVTPQTDSFEALRLFRSDPNQFDLVITDMTMPKMTGDKLAQEIFKIRPDMPIILSTGYSDKISEARAQELGIRKYIEKPIEIEKLAGSVREVFDGK